MRYPSARHRNGYHCTRTKAQRLNRWLLYLAAGLLVIGAIRCVMYCQQVPPAEQGGQWASRHQ